MSNLAVHPESSPELIYVEGLGWRQKATVSGHEGFMVDDLWEMFQTGIPEMDNNETMSQIKEHLSATPIRRPLKQVYLASFEDGVVKIGVSASPKKRIAQVSKASGRKPAKAHITKATPYALKIESEFKAHFAKFCTNGEFYKLPYHAALDFLQNQVEQINE